MIYHDLWPIVIKMNYYRAFIFSVCVHVIVVEIWAHGEGIFGQLNEVGKRLLIIVLVQDCPIELPTVMGMVSISVQYSSH